MYSPLILFLKKSKRLYRFFLLGIFFPLVAQEELSYLYARLKPNSVTEHFVFYELYPETKEGKQALQHAWNLLSHHSLTQIPSTTLPKLDLCQILSLSGQLQLSKAELLSEEQKGWITFLSAPLQHHKKRGHSLWDLKEIQKLPSSEIDFTRTLFLAELGPDRSVIKQYEALLDLLALQALAKVSLNPSDEEKLDAITELIFHDFAFRFPPHSIHVEEIDTYTFLPSVLDSRQGVCLGVSILYLALSERLGIPLEPVTPPGHIYLRYRRDDGSFRNIETTARGIDLPSSSYLSVNAHSLNVRTLKEVIGLSLINRGSAMQQRGAFTKALSLYEKALPFVQDPILERALGFSLIFAGKKSQGIQRLYQVKNQKEPDLLFQDTTVEDYLLGRMDEAAFFTLLTPVDASQSSILQKQHQLETLLKKFPLFRQGWLSLAITHLQLSENNCALNALSTYIELTHEDPNAHYYISYLYLQRHHLKKAWHHLQQAEKYTPHKPKALFHLRKQLEALSLEPCCSSPSS